MAQEIETARPLGQQSITSRTGSLTDQPLSTLQTAILSRPDPGELLKRTNAVLGLYYDPDLDPATKAELRQEFVLALQTYPEWAVMQAFDRWVASGTRRPTPAEILMLVDRAMEPILMAIKAKQRESQPPEPEFKPISDEQRARADDIMRKHGFTPEAAVALKRFPMAGSIKEAINKKADWEKPAPHWSETATPDDPRWEMLRKSRIASGMIKEEPTE